MKLFEEFKEYENLWEVFELSAADKLLLAMDDFEFEYDGWSEDGYEDHFNPNSYYGHYQTRKTYEHNDFTYTVDAVSVFETVRDEMLPNMPDKISNAELAAEYKKLEAAWTNATKETEDEAGEILDLFIAKNLDAFVDDFYTELKAYYRENAYDWARDNW